MSATALRETFGRDLAMPRSRSTALPQAAEADALRQFTPLARIGGGHHGVVRGQPHLVRYFAGVRPVEVAAELNHCDRSISVHNGDKLEEKQQAGFDITCAYNQGLGDLHDGPARFN